MVFLVIEIMDELEKLKLLLESRDLHISHQEDKIDNMFIKNKQLEL